MLDHREGYKRAGGVVPMRAGTGGAERDRDNPEPGDEERDPDQEQRGLREDEEGEGDRLRQDGHPLHPHQQDLRVRRPRRRAARAPDVGDHRPRREGDPPPAGRDPLQGGLHALRGQRHQLRLHPAREAHGPEGGHLREDPREDPEAGDGRPAREQEHPHGPRDRGARVPEEDRRGDGDLPGGRRGAAGGGHAQHALQPAARGQGRDRQNQEGEALRAHPLGRLRRERREAGRLPGHPPRVPAPGAEHLQQDEVDKGGAARRQDAGDNDRGRAQRHPLPAGGRHRHQHQRQVRAQHQRRRRRHPLRKHLQDPRHGQVPQEGQPLHILKFVLGLRVQHSNAANSIRSPFPLQHIHVASLECSGNELFLFNRGRFFQSFIMFRV